MEGTGSKSPGRGCDRPRPRHPSASRLCTSPTRFCGRLSWRGGSKEPRAGWSSRVCDRRRCNAQAHSRGTQANLFLEARTREKDPFATNVATGCKPASPPHVRAPSGECGKTDGQGSFHWRPVASSPTVANGLGQPTNDSLRGRRNGRIVFHLAADRGGRGSAATSSLAQHRRGTKRCAPEWLGVDERE